VLTAFAQAFRTPDLRKKLLFVLFILVLFRIGSSIPAPGVSVKNINYCLDLESSNGNNIYDFRCRFASVVGLGEHRLA